MYMENNNYNINIDDIMSEFSTTFPQSSQEKPKQQSVSDREVKSSNAAYSENKAKNAASSSKRASDSELSKMWDEVSSYERRKKTEQKTMRQGTVKEKNSDYIDTRAVPEKKVREKRCTDNTDDDRSPMKTRGVDYKRILSVVFSLGLIICLVWGLFNINPYKSSSSSSQKPVATPVAAAVQTTQTTVPADTAVQNETAESSDDPSDEEASVEEVVYTPKYTLAEGQMAPKPNSSCYGQVSVNDASKVLEVIQQARDIGLLKEDETIAFNPSAQFNTGSYYQDIMYYFDETILTICWKEIIEGSTVTFCETKIADGSQIRMEVYGDIYDENDNSYLQQMALANNSVVAMNSDKCKARGDGILVYERTLYKYNENTYAGALKRYNCLDNCLVKGNGDFIFTKRLEEMTTDEMNQFIADNDVIFSISFGPLLIENGEMVYGYNPGDDNYIEYAFGETEKPYSRCGMGQIDERHYLYCSLNHSDEQEARWTMRDFANHMYAKGVFKNFYALDGGQTAELVINDTIYNHIDYGAERYTSNCIYFATAIPDGG